MTYLDAAYQILQQTAHPLHYRAITERALAAGLIQPTGLTPEATMGSRLYTQTQEDGSPFVRSSQGRGIFGLAEWQPAGIDHQVQRINQETLTELRRLLHTMPADRFEALIGELLIKMGFDESTVQITPFSGDKGIDVTGILRAAGLTEVDTAVQVKRWKGNVGSKMVRHPGPAPRRPLRRPLRRHRCQLPWTQTAICRTQRRGHVQSRADSRV
jgi:restriction system protein